MPGAIERFWAKVNKDGPNGCWIWTGATKSKTPTLAYGHLRADGRYWGAHKYSYQQIAGRPIPHGHHLDHLCRNPRCVNPDHLEPVTCRENVLRGIGPAARQSRQSHCKRGHALAGDNLVINGRHRNCRTCIRLIVKAKYDPQKRSAYMKQWLASRSDDYRQRQKEYARLAYQRRRGLAATP